jgi:hypothetical protein
MNETMDKLLVGAVLVVSVGVAVELGRIFLTLAS